jgi:acylphosphatase
MPNIAAHVYVAGLVQGVAFRYYARREARSLGITGWVKNLHDGRVELLFEGEEAAVDQMVDWCRHGPRSAHVMDIQIERYPYSGKYAAFEVTF